LVWVPSDSRVKPPFGGSRNFLALADGSDPQRPFTASIADRERPPPAKDRGILARFMSAIGGGRQRLFSESAAASVELAAKPQWSNATLRFVEDQNTLYVGIAKYSGYQHVVEVTVPVTIGAKPQSIFMRALSWFKDSPTGPKSAEMRKSIENIFKTSEQIDVQEALIRYKTLMVDHFGATNVEMHLSREGSDIVVVELDADEARRRG
jgi:hypothetical protein